MDQEDIDLLAADEDFDLPDTEPEVIAPFGAIFYWNQMPDGEGPVPYSPEYTDTHECVLPPELDQEHLQDFLDIHHYNGAYNYLKTLTWCCDWCEGANLSQIPLPSFEGRNKKVEIKNNKVE